MIQVWAVFILISLFMFVAKDILCDNREYTNKATSSTPPFEKFHIKKTQGLVLSRVFIVAF